MHEIRVSIISPEAADHGVAELWAADGLIGYTSRIWTDCGTLLASGAGQLLCRPVKPG